MSLVPNGGYDGWTRLHIALSGTNTKRVIDLLKELFSNPPSDSNIEELDLPSLKHKQAAAVSAKEADTIVKQEHGPFKEIKYVRDLDDCIPVDFGIEPDLVPKVTDVFYCP